MTTDCGKFEAMLASHLEGELSDEQAVWMEAHAAECAECGAVAADLRRIAREAGSLPPLAPSRDLWSGIEARISAPVIPLTTSHGAARRFIPSFGWNAAIAAALVLATAGVTYLATSRSYRNAADNQRVAVRASAPEVVPPVTAPSNAAQQTRTPPSAAQPSRDANASGATGQREGARLAAGGPPRGTRSANAVNRSEDTWSIQADALYSSEIRTLERIVSQRNSTLDPATVAIIKRNLDVIDAAIEQSKAALARDPGSTLLYDQLTHTLNKKVDLLRTAAGLASST